MEKDAANQTPKDIFIRELNQRIELYVAKVEKARNELTQFSGLLHSCIALWENETGNQLPEDWLRRAGMARAIPVPAVAPVLLQNLGVPEAVFELMKGIDGALHLNAIVERLLSRGYKPNVKDLKARVRAALIRGIRRGIYERVSPNTFRINASVRSKRYQDVY